MSLFINGIDRTPLNSLVSLINPTGDEVANQIDYTTNKAISGTDYGFKINWTDTLSPATVSYPFDVQKGGTSILCVDGTNSRVGIGVVNPSTKFEVKGVTRITSADTTDYVDITNLKLDSSNSNTDFTILSGKDIYFQEYLGGVQGRMAIVSGSVGIGTTSPDRLFHPESSTALTNTVSYAARFSHITSGTPANSIGVGLEFEQETSASNNEVIATIESVVTDVTAASEDADLVVKLMAAGAAAAEKFRLSSAGNITFGIGSGDNAVLSPRVENAGVEISGAATRFGGAYMILTGAANAEPGVVNFTHGNYNAAAPTSQIKFRYANNGAVTVQAIIDYTGYLGIGSNFGTGTPDRLLHAEHNSALTNTIQQVARITHTTSGVPANSIGVGLEFEQETSASNNEVIATIESVVTDVTAASEDADLVVKLMAAGAAAAEKFRVKSDGRVLPALEYETIYIDAGAMIPCTTNPPLAGTKEYGTNDIDMDYYAFDSGVTEERVQFKIKLPESWNLGTIKAKFDWSSDTGSTAGDTVEWGIKAGALSDDDAIDTALGTAQVITDTLLANNGADIQITAATPALTIAGTPAVNDMLIFEIYRNTDGTDDMAEDAWLFGVTLQYAKTVLVDAW